MKVQTNVAEKQEIFVIDVDAKIARIVSELDRKNLVDAYLKLFTNFSILNWTNGCSLGCAWQKGLGQCGSFVDVKKAANPAAQYLKSAYKSHKSYWSRVIMTSKISENKNNLDSSVGANVRASAMKKIRETMDYINLILAKYNEYMIAMNIEKSYSLQHQPSVQNTKGMAMTVPQSMPAPVIERTQMMPEKVPAEHVAAKPVVRPVAKPMEQVVAKPVARPVAKPMEQVVAKPVVRPVAKPMEQVVTKPVVRPVDKPMEQVVAKPVVRPVAKPMEPVVAKPVVRPVAKPMEQVVAKPVARPVAKPMEQVVTKPVARPVAKPMEQVVTKPVARPVAKPMEQVVAKPVVRPVAKPMEQVVAKPIAHPIEKKPDNAIKFIGAKQKVIEQGACIHLNMKKQQINLVALQNFAQRAA